MTNELTKLQYIIQALEDRHYDLGQESQVANNDRHFNRLLDISTGIEFAIHIIYKHYPELIPEFYYPFDYSDFDNPEEPD